MTTVLRFGPFRLDVADRSLTRDGVPVPLPPKPFDVLRELVLAAPRLIDKDTLLRAVWNDVVVEEGSLAKAVFAVRQALGGDGYVATVPRAGYRFVAPVTPESPPAAVASDTPSLAVLPFRDVSPDGDQDYFCEGMADEITDALVRVPGLRVASRTSVFQWKDRPADVKEIAAALDVAWVLEGSVRKAGDELRITVQLVRASDGFHVWSFRWDRRVGDVFAVQQELASTVAGILTAGVNANRQVVSITPSTTDVEAYNLYLRGRWLWNSRRGDNLYEALRAFEAAIARDPNFAVAHTGVADAWAVLGGWETGRVPPAEAMPRASAAAAKALELDPESAHAHTSMAHVVLHWEWDTERALALFRRALALNPQQANAHHWHSHALLARGAVGESLQASRRAIELQPTNALLGVHLAWHHWMAREAPAGLEAAERVCRTHGDFPWSHSAHGFALEQSGRGDEAVDACRTAVRLSGEDGTMVASLGWILARAGDRAAATASADALARRPHARQTFPYEIATIYSALGDRTAATDWLQAAITARSGGIAYLTADPRLDGLRDDPAWPSLLARARPMESAAPDPRRGAKGRQK